MPGGGARGLGRDALVRHVAAPGADPNRLHAGMDAFSRFGTNFHEREGRFFFDSEENEHAKVELEAVKLNDETARAEVVRLWQRDVFGDTRHSVVFQDPATTRQALDALERKPPRYVLAPRRLSAPERHGLYMGLERRNQVLLLEPRDHRTDHLANPDMLALARGVRAAAQLAEAASSGRAPRPVRAHRPRAHAGDRAPPQIGRTRLRADRRVGRDPGPDRLRRGEPGRGEHPRGGAELPSHAALPRRRCSRSISGTGSTTSSTSAWTGSTAPIATPWASRSP